VQQPIESTYAQPIPKDPWRRCGSGRVEERRDRLVRAERSTIAILRKNTQPLYALIKESKYILFYKQNLVDFLHIRNGINTCRTVFGNLEVTRYGVSMGRHKSRHIRRDSSIKSRSKRHCSPSSSRLGKGKKNDWVVEFERVIKNLDRRACSPCIHRGDELMIPFFDLVRDDLTIEKLIQHVEGLAEQYDGMIAPLWDLYRSI